VPANTEIPVTSDKDVVAARQQGRALAVELGFTSSDATLIATAISELSRNIVTYAGTGVVVLRRVTGPRGFGLTIEALDRGPGIADVERAVRDGYSSSGGLGLGLPGVRRLMDEFQVNSSLGNGTSVVVTKWLR
jgi:serine/threonine-protein kinase RsbT